MKKTLTLTTLLLTLILCSGAWGATYYVTQLGSGDGLGGDIDNHASVAYFNAGSGVFADLDNDTVYFVGTITTTINPVDNGADASNMITLRGDLAGSECTVDVAHASNYCIDLTNVAFTEVVGFICDDSDSYAVNIVGAGSGGNYIHDIDILGDCDLGFNWRQLPNCTIEDVSITGVANAFVFGNNATEVAGLVVSDCSTTNCTGSGFFFNRTIAPTVSNISATDSGLAGVKITDVNGGTFDGINITTTSLHGFEFTDNTDDPITVSNLSVTGAGFDGIHIEGATSDHVFSGLTVSGCTSEGIYVLDSTGDLTISTGTVTTCGGGVEIDDCDADVGSTMSNITSYSNTFGHCFDVGTDDGAGSADWTLSNCIAYDGGNTGFTITDADDITLDTCTAYEFDSSGFNVGASVSGIVNINCTAHTNDVDGFTTYDGGDADYYRCLAYNNLAGDGFTAHDGCTVNFYNCIARNNLYSGFAMVGSAEGSIINCTAANNLDENVDSRAGIFITCTSGAGWTLTNNISSGNTYTAIQLSAWTVANITSNYNCFYHSVADETCRVGAVKMSFADYVTAMGGEELDSINVDPIFTSSYGIGAASPCINAGDYIAGIHNQATAATDYAGISILRQPDIGAYQYSDQNVYIDYDTSNTVLNGTKAYPFDAATGFDFTTDGYALRDGADIYLKGTVTDDIDLSSLTEANPNIVIYPLGNNEVRFSGTFTPKGSNTYLSIYSEGSGSSDGWDGGGWQ